MTLPGVDRTSAPDFVVVGHVVKDVVGDGWRPGGTVTFAAVQAHRLGMSVGVVTRAADELDVAALLPFAEIESRPSARATTFENVYSGGHRRQKVRAEGDAIDDGDVPEAWRAAAIVLVGPVFGEVSATLASTFARDSLVAVSAQGWLRAVDVDGNVVRKAWRGDPFWRGADVVFVSDEDLEDGRDQLDAWTRDVPTVAMTESSRGGTVWSGGRWRRMDAFPEPEVDPTGAGDTFAAAFLIRLHETGDVDEAARFGAAAASLSVGGVGTAATPARDEIERRMRLHPEVALR
jgi:sugar/nucleoside kinase (ribokinase family)